MNHDHHIWRVWGNQLHRWGLKAFVAASLEALGPLTVVGAQLVYIGQPVLQTWLPGKHLEAVARLLEDTDATEKFVSYLREGDLKWT